MLEKDAGRTAHRKFAASSAIETGLSQVNDPKQGARLVRAFLRIANPAVRLAIVQRSRRLGLLPRNRDRYRLPQCWEIGSGRMTWLGT